MVHIATGGLPMTWSTNTPTKKSWQVRNSEYGSCHPSFLELCCRFALRSRASLLIHSHSRLVHNKNSASFHSLCINSHFLFWISYSHCLHYWLGLRSYFLQSNAVDTSTILASDVVPVLFIFLVCLFPWPDLMYIFFIVFPTFLVRHTLFLSRAVQVLFVSIDHAAGFRFHLCYFISYTTS
jgi:hypothetical protein